MGWYTCDTCREVILLRAERLLLVHSGMCPERFNNFRLRSQNFAAIDNLNVPRLTRIRDDIVYLCVCMRGCDIFCKRSACVGYICTLVCRSVVDFTVWHNVLYQILTCPSSERDVSTFTMHTWEWRD